MLKKFFGELELKEGEIEGVASTEKADRDGEVIKQDGWDLKNFKANPVILAAHNYHDFPIGKATNVKVVDNKLTFKMQFSQATQKAIEAYQLVQEGILRTFSVGFIPREYDEKNQNIITKAELLEISLVAVPANPQAIVTAKSFKENKLAEYLVKEWLLDDNNKKEVDLIEKSTTQTDEGISKEKGEDSAEVVAKKLDVKLLRLATGYLQEILRDIKKGGAKK